MGFEGQVVGGRVVDPYHRALNRSSEAMAQGPHRLARAQLFYKESARAANRLGLPFNQKFGIVPGGRHLAAGTSIAAADCFTDN